jgi:hypothetical protein
MSDPKQHDWAFWLICYSVLLNIVMIITLGVFFWNAFMRSEFNAGWIACRNNMGIVEVKK